jgi:UDP-N-acetylmuramoyl-L-alanyl-D-glutamate--2,6-diaminopimelate ligase
MIEKILAVLKQRIPRSLFATLQPAYHYLLALAAAVWYWFPSRALKVVVVTGTKGKSTTVELVTAILEEAGYRVASLSTIQFNIAGKAERNYYKMTTPGRFFVQRFLHRAVQTKCTYAVLEITSEAARQYRHCFIDFDALIFTNLSPEHIESHGSYEKYRDAKLSLARALARSRKRPRVVVANADDKEGHRFLETAVETRVPYRISECAQLFDTLLVGRFNQENILAAVAFAHTQNIGEDVARRAVAKVRIIPGRVEFIQHEPFAVVVDYAHTPDSLEKLYTAFAGKRLICVLGNTGGGRDTWKRPAMGAIAEKYCADIILTNEDPYDEEPEKIVREMAAGMKNKKPAIVMDRREAIRRALQLARAGDAVLITGKGTDPYIMGARGAKKPWDDREVVRGELEKM